jgi:predicted DNA-binding protein with PD1-like motif
MMLSSSQDVYAWRLLPGEDLKQVLQSFAEKRDLKAAYIITCVGSLQKAHLRLAGATERSTWTTKMEIVSLVGTLFNGGCHLHISLADGQGNMFGGHLLDGCIVNTTAEIVIGEAKGLEFYRDTDPQTGYLELGIKGRSS